jgi:hypothetical protein
MRNSRPKRGKGRAKEAAWGEVNAADWQAGCEGIVLGLCEMLRATGRGVCPAAVIEMLRGIPREGENVKETSLFYRCAKEYGGKADGRSKIEGVSEVMRMPEPRRSIVVASIIGSLLGWGMKCP